MNTYILPWSAGETLRTELSLLTFVSLFRVRLRRKKVRNMQNRQSVQKYLYNSSSWQHNKLYYYYYFYLVHSCFSPVDGQPLRTTRTDMRHRDLAFNRVFSTSKARTLSPITSLQSTVYAPTMDPIQSLHTEKLQDKIIKQYLLLASHTCL